MADFEQNSIHVLSSKPMLDIFRLLVEGPKTIKEIEGRLSLSYMTIRYHLRDLEHGGYVGRYEVKNKSGRPTYLYALRRDFPVLMFPERRYQELAESLLTSYSAGMGLEELKKALRKFGFIIGKESFSRAAENNAEIYSLADFKRIIVRMCSNPVRLAWIIEDSLNRLRYRIYNCPFQELSTKHDDFFCDAVLQGYKDSLKEVSKGRVSLVQTKRIISGEGFCEYEASDETELDLNSQGTEGQQPLRLS